MSLAIPEESYLQICAAAAQLDPPLRRQFLEAVAAELVALGDAGEGAVARAIRQHFRAHFHPPFDTRDQYAPHHKRSKAEGLGRVA